MRAAVLGVAGLTVAGLLVAGLLVIGPILLGLFETLRAAFGVLPALGLTEWSLEPWRMLLASPGFASSLGISLFTGIASTLIALILALGFCASGPRPMRWLAPFLATPHAAMAVGLAFVLAPSGWIARLLAPAFGWQRPPDIVTLHDGWGLALMLALVVKELPFLLLMLASARAQLPEARLIAAGRALGYGPVQAWGTLVLPQLWPLIRLPVWVVLAYGLSVVDMALVLGPSNPPSLAVAVLRWYGNPDLRLLLPAAAGAVVQVGLVAASVLGFWLMEPVFAAAGRHWLRRGGRGSAQLWSWTQGAVSLLVWALMLLAALAVAALVIWSLVWRWPFPALWPAVWSGAAWATPVTSWAAPLCNTLLLAAASVALALLLAIGWLQAEAGRPMRGRGFFIYLPLVLPQIGFLFGLNILALRLGLSGGYAAVIWGQSLFVFPYVMLSLSGPWQALDPRLLRAAAALGAGPWRRLWRLRLPLLLRPLLAAAAVGVAVSVAQYLPTLFLGAGRIATLTTEAVALSSGADRRLLAVYASLQAALPLLAYAIAVTLPPIWHRNRRGLRGGGV